MTAPDRRPADIADLRARVDLVELVGRTVELKPRGKHEHWGCCPFRGERTPSFKVHAEQQTFHCFGCGAHGDVLDFLEGVEGLGKAAAIARLVELSGSSVTSPAPPRVPRRDPMPTDNGSAANRELAQQIWRETEVIRDPLALSYLGDRRKIDTWDDDRLRWHPHCPWRDEETGELLRVGAIIAPVVDHVTGHICAIWRIRPVLQGPVQRRGLGPTKGNAARLAWAPGPRLIVAEGVEDALAATKLFGLPAWAALSAGNMGALVLPERLSEVLVLADHDANGAGLAGAHALARRLKAGGRWAGVRWPTSRKDVNDVAMGRAAS
jgi:DNA primase